MSSYLPIECSRRPSIPESGRLRSEVLMEEAWDLLRDMVGPVRGVRLAVSKALDRIALEGIVAKIDLPPGDMARMDGYAVGTSGPPEGGLFRVVGRIRAGQVWDGVVRKGEAVEVMTGCILPPGCDAVLPLEEVQSLRGGFIRHEGPLVSGMNVVRAGTEIRRGQLLTRPGMRLRPGDLAVLASEGRRTVVVGRRPRIGVLVTGDELVLPGERLPEGRRYSSNGLYIEALAKRDGARVTLCDPVPDRVTALREALEDLSRSDLVVVSGGTGKGAGDLVHGVLEASGARCVFAGLRVRPGRTSSLYLWRGRPVVTLPGRPGGMRVGFEVLVRPAIHWLQGERQWRPPRIEGILQSPVGRHRHVYQLREAHIEMAGGTVRVLPLSSDLKGGSLFTGRSRGWVEIPPGDGMVGRGEVVTVWLKGSGGFGEARGMEQWEPSP